MARSKSILYLFFLFFGMLDYLTPETQTNTGIGILSMLAADSNRPKQSTQPIPATTSKPTFQVVEDTQSTTISYSFFPIVDQLLKSHSPKSLTISSSSAGTVVPTTNININSARDSQSISEPSLAGNINARSTTHFTERSSLDSLDSRERVFSTPPPESQTNENVPARLPNPNDDEKKENQCPLNDAQNVDVNHNDANGNQLDDPGGNANEHRNRKEDSDSARFEDYFQTVSTFVDARIWIALMTCVFQILWSCMTTSSNDLAPTTYLHLQILYYIFTISTSIWLIILYTPVRVLRAIMIKLKICCNVNTTTQYYLCCCDDELLPPWQREPPESTPGGRRRQTCWQACQYNCRQCKNSCVLDSQCCKSEVRYSRLPMEPSQNVNANDDKHNATVAKYFHQVHNKCLQWIDEGADEKWLFGMSLWIVGAGISFLTLFVLLPRDAIQVSFRTQATFGTISEVLSARVPISKWTIFVTFFATPCVCAWIAMRNLIQRCYLGFELWYPM